MAVTIVFQFGWTSETQTFYLLDLDVAKKK